MRIRNRSTIKRLTSRLRGIDIPESISRPFATRQTRKRYTRRGRRQTILTFIMGAIGYNRYVAPQIREIRAEGFAQWRQQVQQNGLLQTLSRRSELRDLSGRTGHDLSHRDSTRAPSAMPTGSPLVNR